MDSIPDPAGDEGPHRRADSPERSGCRREIHSVDRAGFTTLWRMNDLYAAAAEWIAGDPDPTTRAELQRIVDSGDVDELAERMGATLQFGTAGLRGRVEAGSNRMNRVLVTQAAAGLAAYLRERAGTDATPRVVIGYDGRRNSDVFARDSAEIFAGAGFEAVLLPRLLPTPVLAFAVRHLLVAASIPRPPRASDAGFATGF